MRLARRFFTLAAGGVIAWGCGRETIGLGLNPVDASSPADVVVSEVPTAGRDAAPPPPTTSMPTSMATERPPEPVRIPTHPPWSRDAGHETTTEPVHPVATDAGHGCAPECDGTAPFCRLDTRKCVKCLVDLTCPSTAPRCDPLTNECVCTSDMDCRRSTGTCDSLTRQCLIGCSQTLTCTQFFVAPICDISRGVCVDCLTGDDCKGKSLFGVPIELCRRGFCVQCEEEADCADSKRHCQTREGICMECLKPEHCPTGLQCFNGRCIPA
jgi:hypothetical protein